MMSASLNYCEKMGTEPGRGFLKQPTAKLEPVIVENLKITEQTKFII